jgi:hypothetical protein
MKLTAFMALFVALTASSVNAAETTATTTTSNTSTGSLKSFYNKVKESPFSQAYLNDTYSEYNIDGVTSYHYLYNHWNFTKKHRVSVIPAFKTDLKKKDANNDRVNNTRYHATQLRYAFSGILNQTDHGLNFSAQGRYYINSSYNADRTGSDGYGRVILSASRSIGKNNLSLSTDSVVYNKNASKSSYTHYNKLGVGYGYRFTDTFGASSSMNWYRFDHNNSDSITEYSYYSLALDYTTSFGLNISPYMEGVVTQAQDGRSGLAKDVVKNSSVGLSLYISWF